ncbi:Ldh family oxidoreductase [Tropicimonas sp. IMCC6043]|uniref:Ldh family oxidoreductase n=1 Tax=Tropicimonas sp. IMCC6043 TaxID=2510645 RepID=UPI00101C9804|nr:Ldh family oxidoreductase [Tropicimonas sp. IMCC6043]RYH06659.1 FCD domain-containing protein [Tropicimonas sp. IMCC6043]
MTQTFSKKPVERQMLSDQAHEAILGCIVSGQFPLGRKLPESELSLMLGMSKSPIREALRQLEREGLVVLSASRTCRVFDLGPAEISDLGELRRLLECEAMTRAARRNPVPLLGRVRAIVDEMQGALQVLDTDRYKQLDHDFHSAFFDLSGNEFLKDNFRTLSFRIQALRNRLSQDPELNRKSLADHIAIRDALEANDVEVALVILRQHIEGTTQSHVDRLENSQGAPTVSNEEPAVRVDLRDMAVYSKAALRCVGADAATVESVTQVLLHASTLGVDSHGFRLLPHYLSALQGGRINGKPDLRVISRNAGAAVLDADNGHGARATCEAADLAVEMARENGIAAVAIRNSSHFGAAGAYALQIATKGMMGLAFCNSDSFVRMHGGAECFHGTNPIAAAAPVRDGAAWLLDMATSSVPFNRVLLYRSLGLDLPPDVASDEAGENVTDPQLARMLAPLGGALFGYKGAGLGGLVEILSAAFGDSPLSFELAPMVSDDMSTPRRLGALVMAIDPEAFSGGEAFRDLMARYLEAIRRGAKAPGQVVMAPGDREWAEAETRRKIGIKLDMKTVESLRQFSDNNAISPLRTMRAVEET